MGKRLTGLIALWFAVVLVVVACSETVYPNATGPYRIVTGTVCEIH